MMKYTIIIEEGDSSYGAFVPDLPGCIAVGETKQETIELISEAIEFHIEGLHEDGNIIPTPHSHCNIAYVEVETRTKQELIVPVI